MYLALLIVIFIYLALYALSSNKSSSDGRHIDASSRTFEVKLFQVKLYTQAFNRTFSRLGTWRPCLLNSWFSSGAVASVLLILPSLVLLVKTLCDAVFISSEDADGAHSQAIVLQPVLPGVNMPLADFGYYFVTLLICSVIHEAGHAIAAVNEDVRVLGFGFLVLFLLPAAFVDLPTDQLMALRPFQRLKVFSAGIWHNLTLAAFAYFLFFSVPTLVSPLYESGDGVSLSWVDPASSVRGPTGLEAGDVIKDINSCRVRNKSDWRDCISKAIVAPTFGICLADQRVAELDRKSQSDERDQSVIKNCCDGLEDAKDSLCFMDAKSDFRACLPVRLSLEAMTRQCGDDDDVCADSNRCLRPDLGNASRLLRVRRSDKRDFLFVGSPVEVYQGVATADYAPLLPWFPNGQWPHRLELLAYYAASFSGALAVLNVVPCFMLDGQHMIRVVVEIAFGAKRDLVAFTFTVVGTILLVANVLVGIWKLF